MWLNSVNPKESGNPKNRSYLSISGNSKTLWEYRAKPKKKSFVNNKRQKINSEGVETRKPPPKGLKPMVKV
ncbi:hypothetical protein BZZ01_27975 [Nostocales cyanobacterium HT-58-2]|nr:hypothetical protein BZZ01_27975 [Nostocales cyanobacterium HT-58-2]